MENIPLVLQYIVPGFILLKIFEFFISRKYDIKICLAVSCVISYVLISIVALIRNIGKLSYIPNDVITNSAIAIIFGALIGFVFGIIFNTKRFSKILIWATRRSQYNDIWHDVFDFSKGTSLKVYLKNKDYYVIGVLSNMELNSKDPWWAICKIAKYDVETNLAYKNEPSYLNDENVLYTFRLSDVDHMEIFKERRE